MSVGPPPSDEPQKRRPTYRGVIQQDVTRGVERVRRWPRRRPSKPPKAVADNLEKFRQIQKAWQFYTPDGHPWVIDQVEGSPLLPRDVWTMMMSNRLFQITTLDGKDLWPMPARTDVSEALDVLGKTPNSTLVRGPNYWEAFAHGPGGTPGPFLALAERNSTYAMAGTGWVVTQYNNPISDPGGWWDAANHGFKPTLAGHFLCLSATSCTTKAPRQAALFRNGSVVQAVGIDADGSFQRVSGVGFLYADGVNDVLQGGTRLLFNATNNGLTSSNIFAILGPFT